MSPQALRRKILKLEVKAPITEKLQAEFASRKSRKLDAWYSSQKEHWLGWLKEYDGPGYYGRENWDVEAKTVFNRVVNPCMVLWLGEACGLPRKQVQAAAAAALAAEDRMAAQSGAIRKVIPWADIEAKL